MRLYFFPFPHIIDGQKNDGSMFPWPDKCRVCPTNNCNNKDLSNSLSLCSYGYNYQRVSKDFVIGGIVIREWDTLTPARKKRAKEAGSSIILIEHLKNVVANYLKCYESMEDWIEQEKLKLIQDYITNEQYKTDFLKPLRETIMSGLSFVHDYKQINSQIAQNINVIILTKYQAATFEEKVDMATEQEKAIYKASKLLEEKLNVARFLLNPEWLELKDRCKTFRFHGLVVKYLRIYAPRYESKNITVNVMGKSFQEIIANDEAVAVIPHTLIDNAVKYSPKFGIVDIYMQDVENGIDFSVSSYGPRILPYEKGKLFQPFYRGEAARKQEEEGAGYGLYVAQTVAKNHLGTEIFYNQDTVQKPKFGHWTTFSVKIPLKCKILP